MVILKMDGHVLDNAENLRFMSDKVRSITERLLDSYVREYELTAFDSSFYLLLNFEEEQRANIRRQMKTLLDEMRIQGDILKDFSVTMALGTICQRIGYFSEKCPTLDRGTPGRRKR